MKHSCVGSSPVNHQRAPIPGHRSPLAERPTRLARDVAAVAVVSLLGDAIDPRLPQILPPHLPVLRPLPKQRDGAHEVLRVGEHREGRNLDPPVHPVGPQDREDPVGRLALQHRDTQG